MKSNITTAPKKAQSRPRVRDPRLRILRRARHRQSRDQRRRRRDVERSNARSASRSVRVAALVASLDAVARRRGAHLRACDRQPRRRSAARSRMESERIPPQLLALRRRGGDGMKRASLIVAGARYSPSPPRRRRRAYDPNCRSSARSSIHFLPATGRQLVEASCLPCHSADILVQQRLTEKQWTADGRQDDPLGRGDEGDGQARA